jgi:hypothetical protein
MFTNDSYILIIILSAYINENYKYVYRKILKMSQIANIDDSSNGFMSALYMNLSIYDPNKKSPCVYKKDIKDSVESVRLSIESFTPKKTPGGGDKFSNFRFCLSKDLMQRLDENSPLKINRSKTLTNKEINMNNDLFKIVSCSEEDLGKSTLSSDDEDSCSFITPSTICSTNPLGDESESREIDHLNYNHYISNNYYSEEVLKKLSENNQSTFMRSNSMNNMNNMNNVNMRNVSIINNMGRKLSGNTINQVGHGSNMMLYNNALQQLYMQKLSQNCFTPSNHFPQQHFNMGAQQNIPTNTSKTTKGWICASCNNFNYEIRIKCNKCAMARNISESILLSKKSQQAVVPNININNLNLINNIGNLNNMQPQEQNAIPQQAKNSKKKKPFVERVGDWVCVKCKNLNFSFRNSCNRCQLTKEDSEKIFANLSMIATNNSIIPCVQQQEQPQINGSV